MLSLFIGVYRVLYEYSAQSEEELSIQPNDLLYLLEKSDIDDWWKAKKRVVPQGNEVVEEPIGLVPSNYIEEVCIFIFVLVKHRLWGSVSPWSFERVLTNIGARHP